MLIAMKVSLKDLEKIKKNLVKTNKVLIELDEGLDETPEFGNIIKRSEEGFFYNKTNQLKSLQS